MKKILQYILVLTMISTSIIHVSAINENKYDNDYNVLKNAIKSGIINVEPDKASPNLQISKTTNRAGTETGQYPTRRGMYLVTNSIVHTGSAHSSITGHAGMVYGTSWTIESYPDGGVQQKYDKWSDRYSDVIGATTTATTISQDQSIAFYCYQKIGCPYNINFFEYMVEDKFYCSQLVYKAFLEVGGINLKIPTAMVVTPSSLIRLQLVEDNTITIVYTYECIG